MKHIARHRRSLHLLFLLITISHALHAIDFPNYYRANFFYGLPLHINRPWESFSSLRFGTGEGTCANNCHGDKIPIFNTFGCANINTLGQNVDTQGICGECPKPLTQEYLGCNGLIPSFDFTCNNGLLSFTGTFKTWEVDLDWWQNLAWGFYLYGYLPIRHVESIDICYNNLTSPDNPNAVAFQDFLNDEFNAVLAENGLCPVTTPYCKTGLSDPALFLGWHGDKKMPKNGIISDLAGLLQFGVTFPVSPLRDQRYIFSVPLGYEGHWGLGFRLQCEAGIHDWFGFGITAGTNIFLDKKQCLRMVTSCEQSGPIILEKGFTSVDAGQIWDLGCYVNADRLLKGISLLLGYSYTKRERTKLNVQDCNFLHEFLEGECSYGIPPTNVSKNSIVNSAQNLAAWDMNVLHFIFELDLDPLLKTKIAPVLTFFYNWLFTGNRSWRVNTIGGMGGLRIKWAL